LLLLGGCGRQENPSPAEIQPPPAAPVVSHPADNRPVIVAFGDSLTAGFGVGPGLSYPDFLQKELDAAGYSYRVVNEGISGDTTSGGVARVSLVLSQKPSIVILALGANDGLRGIPVARTRENLDQMMAEITQAGARILLAGITLPRNYGPDYIGQFDRIYPELAGKHKTPLLPFLLEGVALNPKLMLPDALHPNANGNRAVAANVMKAVRPLLAR
jgi:acyl-CoA thioesterase-1